MIKQIFRAMPPTEKWALAIFAATVISYGGILYFGMQAWW